MPQEIGRPDVLGAFPAPSSCGGCGAPFHCGIDDPGGCWCAKLSPLPREFYAADGSCLCAKCLHELLAAQAYPRGL